MCNTKIDAHLHLTKIPVFLYLHVVVLNQDPACSLQARDLETDN